MQAWEQFLKAQEEELGVETVYKWLRSLKIQRFDACNLYLEAKDSFQALWFEEHVRGKAQATLLNGNHKKIKIHLSIANAPTAKKQTEKKKKELFTSKSFQLHFDELDPFCLFQHFTVSEDNTLTYKLLYNISQPEISNQLGNFNPIYIYGPSGSGKTHLLMSVAHAFQSQGMKAIYVRAETFTDHVVTAIRAGEMSIFRQAYRHARILIVDDIHVFSRKGATQEEFFHTFNTLHLEGKQIILSANCTPAELQLIEPRLISRFEWGIVLPLKCLQPEQMGQLIQKRLEILQVSPPPKIIDFLMETFISNPKMLVKALDALILRLHIDPRYPISTLNIPLVKTILSDLITEEQQAVLTPHKVVQAVAEQYGIKIEDILGKAQSRDCALPRQLAMHICRHQLKMPFMKIGDLFSRDHSTVMSSIKQIQKALDQDERDISSSLHSVLKKIQR
jgi:chromosomal replication initiator protein